MNTSRKSFVINMMGGGIKYGGRGLKTICVGSFLRVQVSLKGAETD